jgi:hypothetical protein
MRGAAIVPRRELINAKRTQASAGELAKGRAPHHAKTANDDVETWHESSQDHRPTCAQCGPDTRRGSAILE